MDVIRQITYTPGRRAAGRPLCFAFPPFPACCYLIISVGRACRIDPFCEHQFPPPQKKPRNLSDLPSSEVHIVTLLNVGEQVNERDSGIGVRVS